MDQYRVHLQKWDKGFIFIDIDCKGWQSWEEGTMLYLCEVKMANADYYILSLSTKVITKTKINPQANSNIDTSVCCPLTPVAVPTVQLCDWLSQTSRQAQMESDLSCRSRPPLTRTTYWFTLWEFSHFGLRPTATHTGLCELWKLLTATRMLV